MASWIVSGSTVLYLLGGSVYILKDADFARGALFVMYGLCNLIIILWVK